MKIDWVEPSILDLEVLREYIAKDTEYYASRFIEKIIQAVVKLGEFPEIGRIVPEAEEENIREIIFHSYRIIYRVEKERILILAIAHGSRDLSKIKPWEI